MAGKKILIIDDEKTFINPVKLFLEKQDFTVLEAYDGFSGLEKARSEHPDLILMDLMLPGMNGYQVCRLLKFDAHYKDIPIFIVSAKDTEEDQNIGKKAGADLYITKPIDFESIVNKMKEYLR